MSRTTADSRRQNLRRYSITVLQFIWAFTFISPAYLDIPEPKLAIETISKDLFCVDSRSYSSPYFFCLTLNGKIPVLLILITILMVIPQGLFYIIGSFRCIYRNKTSSSRATYQFGLKFMFALCLQAVIPILFIVIPACYIIFSLFTRYFNQGFTNLALIFFATHGAISSIVTLMVHKPYRDYTIKAINCFKVIKITERR
ncbi:unnamed protein product [Caenorhabditis angaria]|uniref:Uncharacterized protein n=1 Tax=Caenorhabditis angaria TaxID=860376 RepID=A0A9P1IIC3_9PELO|nr:unnamed protein product [Caenorhabditis angaria]